jgi:hypothetical protein
VTFTPDPTIFEEVDFRAQTVTERLQIMAFLNRGLEIRFVDERKGREAKETFKYNGGIVDYVRHLNNAKESLFRKVGFYEQAEEGQEVEVAFQWNSGYYESIHSFANGISTIEGGMHEEGFRKAITNVVNRYARKRNLLKEKDENLLGEDIREGLTAIISVRLAEPQFEGQTKSKLGNVSIRSLVERGAGVACAHGRAPGARPHPSQECPGRRRTARKTGGLFVQRSARVRTIHCRGKLGRRFGEGRAQSAQPGDLAHPRKDIECRKGALRQNSQEHRNPGSHLCHWRRRRGGFRRDQGSLRQDHLDGRRRR